jgi:hypothetical protein
MTTKVGGRQAADYRFAQRGQYDITHQAPRLGIVLDQN